ncbi:MAG: glycosyltransferase 9 family protein [Alphaproteobacteria bacterium]|nr:MAG: glycosyltransferase 9 family protein [Alphaproteobacteria bacterium]
MSQHEDSTRILIIKLSALGDFIQALGPMAAIRKHHPNAHITLLTTPMFKSFGEQCGYFDDVWIDKRPKTFDLCGWVSLRKKLINGQFSRIYDLQNNDRTSFYFKLFSKHKKPEWVGIAAGASHQNTSPLRTTGHAFNGHQQTLQRAGIENIEIDDLSWIKEDLSRLDLKPPYILFVPGSAPQHPQKRWPHKKYAALAQQLAQNNYQVILLGTVAETEVTKAIENICPNILNLTGQTSLFEIAALAQGADGAIGNDTGPMHMIGPTGCPSLILFSAHSNPARHAPKGANVKTIQRNNLEDLKNDDVFEFLQKILSVDRN